MQPSTAFSETDSFPDQLQAAVRRAREALIRQQQPDGHWLFPLEADATIPAEYILLQHYLDEIDRDVESRLAAYLRRRQAAHGGWPLFFGGEFDMSATVKAYFALKAAGDSPDAPHMARARKAIRARGGAAQANVFTRVLLALFGQVPWRAVPVMPVEIMSLPKWFPFHLDKISYWSRTVIVPLLVLMALKPKARNPHGIHVQELFVTPPVRQRRWLSRPGLSLWARALVGFDRVLRLTEPLFPSRGRQRAIARAVRFVRERLNGEDGLGGIYPAMANAVMMFDALRVPKDHPDVVIAKAALRKLLILEGDNPGEGYCQPCLSPVWDTALACHALIEAGEAGTPAAIRGLDWLIQRQIWDVVGDWRARRPDVPPGGWAFQYANPHYPDLDDTAVVVMALHRADRERYAASISRAVEWILGLQSRNGGFAAFDADNTYHYLNAIPFADHGALLDPPTADVSGRCLGMLGQLSFAPDHPAVEAAIVFLRREQEADGSWFGRWGTNYIYGTWSVLCGLRALGFDRRSPEVMRAAEWLIRRQREDGGWGEDGRSYWPGATHGEGVTSTPSQTAWALLALMAAGLDEHPAVRRGVDYLLATQTADGLWVEEFYTAVGFPRVFYLRYHGYRAYFPLWALARYRNRKANPAAPVFGL